MIIVSTYIVIGTHTAYAARWPNYSSNDILIANREKGRERLKDMAKQKI